VPWNLSDAGPVEDAGADGDADAGTDAGTGGAAGAVQTLASVLERTGEGERARAVLAQGRTQNPEDPALALRAAFAAAHAGAWEDAHAHAADMVRLVDDDAAHAIAARLRFCDGDLEGAWRTAAAAHARFPTSERLLTVGAAVLSALEPARAAALVTAITDPDALSRWAYHLSEVDLHALAIELADRAIVPGLANGIWQAARCRMRHGALATPDGRAEAVELLRRLQSSHPAFPLGLCSLAAALLPDDPEGALAAVDLDCADLTPLRWLIEAEALEALGQTDAAARLRTRLAEVGASIGAGPVSTARRLGTPGRAAALAAIARAGGDDSLPLIAEQAASLAASGRPTEAAAVLAPLADRAETGSSWLIVKTGLAVGALDTVAAVARRRLTELADTQTWTVDDTSDPWWFTAALACADPGSGARARLAAGAPRHPSAWRLL
jgi:hypothetical protein